MQNIIRLLAKPRRTASSRRRSIVRAFARNNDGVAGTEFALISPAFFFMIFVIMETAMVFVAEEVLDDAVYEAARMVRTGQVQSSGLTKDEFRDVICNRAGVFINCESANFYVDVQTFGDFADAGLDSPVGDDGEFIDEGNFAIGGPNDVVTLRAYFKWKTNPIFGDITLSNIAGGRRLLGSFSTFRNEPFVEEE